MSFETSMASLQRSKAQAQARVNQIDIDLPLQQNTVVDLQEERAELVTFLDEVDSALALLNGAND